METSFLKRVGYNVETRLSTIKRSISDAEFDAQREKTSMLPIAAINLSLQELTEPLKRKDMNGLPNPFRLGYKYAERGIDPTIDEIWRSIGDNPQNEGAARWVGTWSMGTEYNDLQTLVTKEITTYIEDILIGYKTFSAIPPLKKKLAIIQRSEVFFTERQAQTKDFDRLIELADLLINMHFTLQDTVAQVVKKRKLIDAMRSTLEQTVTPDIGKTIQDQIEAIKTKITENHSSFEFYGDPYRNGYYMAIRGQDKLIFDIVDAIYYSDMTGLSGLRTANGVYIDESGNKLKRWVNSILEGYAASYHLSYLETRLTVPSKPTERSDGNFAQVATIPKLKWKGQKNQLYDVLRQLKEKELIGNSYEDLAVFIKANVDAFRDTELSTISKQMGRPQKLPKNRRIKLDE